MPQQQTKNHLINEHLNLLKIVFLMVLMTFNYMSQNECLAPFAIYLFFNFSSFLKDSFIHFPFPTWIPNMPGLNAELRYWRYLLFILVAMRIDYWLDSQHNLCARNGCPGPKGHLDFMKHRIPSDKEPYLWMWGHMCLQTSLCSQHSRAWHCRKRCYQQTPGAI